MDDSADALRGSAVSVVGPRSAVEAFAAGRDMLHMERIGGMASATVAGLLDADRAAAAQAGLELSPLSLQQLIIRRTGLRALESATLTSEKRR